jgi:hypothetical protein
MKLNIGENHCGIDLCLVNVGCWEHDGYCGCNETGSDRGDESQCSSGGRNFSHRCNKLKGHQATCNVFGCAVKYCQGDSNDADFIDKYPMLKTVHPEVEQPFTMIDDPSGDGDIIPMGTEEWIYDPSQVTDVWCAAQEDYVRTYPNCPSCCHQLQKGTGGIFGFMKTDDKSWNGFGGKAKDAIDAQHERANNFNPEVGPGPDYFYTDEFNKNGIGAGFNPGATPEERDTDDEFGRFLQKQEYLGASFQGYCQTRCDPKYRYRNSCAEDKDELHDNTIDGSSRLSDDWNPEMRDMASDFRF